MKTLLLDTVNWDLVLDIKGNIALASNPYSIAQDVASAGRLWLGEAPFATNRGIPYDTQVLGHQPPQRLIAGWYEDEAVTVPDVSKASAVLQYDSTTRGVTGQIQLTLTDGGTLGVNF